MTQTEKPITLDDRHGLIQTHLTILQNVIARMATNSTSAKTWCVTIVSAVLVIVADKGKPQYGWLALMPSILMFLLDAYYLALERGFRRAYADFVAKLQAGTADSSDLFDVKPRGHVFRDFCCSIASFSVWPFYLTVAALIVAAGIYVLPAS